MPRSGKKVGLVVGLTVGGVVTVAIVVAVALSVWAVHRRTSSAAESDPNADSARENARVEQDLIARKSEVDRAADLEQRQRILDASASALARVAESENAEAVANAAILRNASTLFGSQLSREQISDLLQRAIRLSKCPNSYRCLAGGTVADASETTYVIERWTDNTATSFVSKLGTNDVLVPPYNLDLFTQTRRTVSQCGGEPISAAGSNLPFVYRVESTLYNKLTLNILLKILIQLFDASAVQSSIVQLKVTAKLYTRSAVSATPFAIINNVGEDETTNNLGAPFFPPLAAQLLTMDNNAMTLTIQNNENPNLSADVRRRQIIASPGDVLRLDITGAASLVIIDASVFVKKSDFFTSASTPEADDDGGC